MELHSLIYIKLKKNYNAQFLTYIRIIHYVYDIIFAHVPKVDSIITSFNRNNFFLHKIMTVIAKMWFILKTTIFKIPVVANITLF